MKKVLVALGVLAFSGVTFAGTIDDLNPRARHFRPNDAVKDAGSDTALGESISNAAKARGNNLVNHGGPVIANAKIVFIFWGSSWSPSESLVTTLQSFRTSSNGLVSHTGMIAQYGASQSGLQGSQADVFDTSNPSGLAVSDAMVRAEVKKWFHGKYNSSTVYEVLIPSGYYSADGGADSCGGPNLQYCAYHSNYSDSGDVKYAIEPYPSCSGCQASGFNTTQNLEHFICHESREAMTDADGTAWYDRSGNEADDKCAWSPAPFIDQATGFGYQLEWSNSAGGCVK